MKPDPAEKKTVTIHQPDFFPWLGFFERWAGSDLLILLDDVQFLRRGWHHRDRIRTASGPAWLSVPVKKKGRYFQWINQVEIDNSTNWQQRHLDRIRHSYAKAPFFSALFPALQDLYACRYERLIDLNLAILEYVASCLDIQTPVVFSSDFGIDASGTRRLVRLTEAAGGRRYLSGLGAKDYLETGLFREKGIQVVWQAFDHPVYDQGDTPFIPMLSILDGMMHLSLDRISSFFNKQPRELCHDIDSFS